MRCRDHLLLSTLLFIAVTSCRDNEESQESCYAMGEGFMTGPASICGREIAAYWEGPGPMPAPYARYVSICDPLLSDGTCETCPAEDFDARLQEEILESQATQAGEGYAGCDEGFAAFARGCVVEVEHTSAPPTCCAQAVYWTKCPPPNVD